MQWVAVIWLAANIIKRTLLVISIYKRYHMQKNLADFFGVFQI